MKLEFFPKMTAVQKLQHARSQACGSREVNARTQQSTNACKASGRAVTLFKSVRIYASMFLHPTRSMNISPQL